MDVPAVAGGSGRAFRASPAAARRDEGSGRTRRDAQLVPGKSSAGGAGHKPGAVGTEQVESRDSEIAETQAKDIQL